MSSIKIVNKILDTILNWVITLIMIAIVLILFIGVILRYIFNAPLFWSEEIAVLGLIWMTFLGGVILVREDKNVCITVFTDMLDPRHSRYIKGLADLVVLPILGVMIWQSWKLTGRLAFSTTPAIRLNEAWFAWAMVVGFILMFYYQIQRVVVFFRNKGRSKL